jgi:hypothetical protein
MAAYLLNGDSGHYLNYQSEQGKRIHMDGQRGFAKGNTLGKGFLSASKEPTNRSLEWRLQGLRRVKMQKKWMQYPWNLEIDTEIRQLEAQLASQTRTSD